MNRRCWYVIMTVALLVGLAGVPDALAAQTGTLYACIHTDPRDKEVHGRIRIVLPTERCHHNETRVVLNQVGPQGPPGPAGPAGPQGPAGPAPQSSLTIFVDASTGEDDPIRGYTAEAPLKTIGYALTRTASNLTIKIAGGTYTETITINENKGWVTLEGAGQNQTIIAGNGTDSTITVYGPSSFRFRQMTIRNGMYGIHVRSARIICENVTITGNVNNGIRGRNNAIVELSGTVVRTNGSDGLHLRVGSAGKILNSEFTENGANGIALQRGSSAEIEGSTIADNQASGIGAYVGSSFSVGTSTIRNNHFSGLDTSNGSAMSSWGGNTIQGNADFSGWRAGVNILNGSSGVIIDGPADQILANNGPGIFVGHNSSLLFKLGQVSNNAMGGVILNSSSTGQFAGGVSITNNTGYGITCWDSKRYDEQPPGDLSGNSLGPTNCP